MAEHAGAPVLVVGDIDRGGVFASFVGTHGSAGPLGAQAGRRLDRQSLPRRRQPAGPGAGLHAAAHRPARAGRGAVSAATRSARRKIRSSSRAARSIRPASNGAAVEIAVIDLPHISNFTDFDAFRSESDVRLRIVRSAGRPESARRRDHSRQQEHAGRPGLSPPQRAGRADRRRWPGKARREIVGICGGFQMLGREIRDPLGIESAAGGFAAGWDCSASTR